MCKTFQNREGQLVWRKPSDKRKQDLSENPVSRKETTNESLG